MTTEKKLTGYPSIDKPWLKYYSEEAINAKLPECTIYEYLWENNKDHLDDVALIYFNRKITYKELFENIEKVAKAFSKIGVKKSDVVTICTVNTPEMVYALYALNRLGAIANMIDPRTNVDGIREYMLETNSKFVLTIDLAYPVIVKATKDIDVEKIVVVSPADSLPPITKVLYKIKNKSPRLNESVLKWREFLGLCNGISPQYASYEKNACCVMAHTGGTTGFPKTVMLSNDNVNAVTFGYRYTGIPFERKQRYFNDLPPFIMYGLCIATHTTLCYGLEVILYPVFDSKGFPRQFVKYKPHHFSALVDHLKYLSVDKKTENCDMSFLVTAAVGGDALECNLEMVVNEFLATHKCEFEVCKGYGMTELAATAVTTFKGANAIGSVGVPLISNTLKIVDVDSNEELGYNEIGEIWIAGPSIMLGYYNKPEETAEIIITDEKGTRWIRTGDLGHITEEGLLFHEGRIRRIYMTAHEGQPAKIFPMLVEDCLRKSNFISECSVVGRKKENSDYYEAVAFVVKKDCDVENKIILADISQKCIDNIPTYMIPTEYCFVNELPHTPIGKIDFRALEKEAEKL